MVLYGTGGSVLVERTLGHLGKDSVHGIVSSVEVNLRLVEHVQTERGKLVAQEFVSEVDLSDDIDKIETFAEDKLQEVAGPPDLCLVVLPDHVHPVLALVSVHEVSDVI